MNPRAASACHPYATPAYAQSLSHWGQAVAVPEWGCSVLSRSLPGGSFDVCGTYPIAVLAEDADLSGGLGRLRGLGAVSVTLVLDDFHRPPLERLRNHFDTVRAFKTHYIRRCDHPFAYNKHHRYRIRRAYRTLVARQLDLTTGLQDWVTLYGTLKQRHGLTGVHDFPLHHFELLRDMPGVAAFGAWMGETLVSVQIWVGHHGRIHGHLAASSPEGYQEGAAYAAYDASMAYFADACVVNLGGGAGVADDPDDGLAVFKRGFCNDTARAYICGAVLDRGRYDALTRHMAPDASAEFFPRYRARPA